MTKKQTAALLENHAGHELVRDIYKRNPGYSEVPGDVYCKTCKAVVMAFQEPMTKVFRQFPVEKLHGKGASQCQ